MLSWLLVLSACVVGGLLYLGYRWLYAPFQLFRNLGIKGPPPQPFFGNLSSRRKMGFMKFHEHLNKKYGPVAGYYTFSMPWLCVTDLDVIKQTHVKEFDSFTDKPYIPDLVREASAHPGLLNARGEEWRTARNTLSPSFSSAKIKAMVPLIKKSVDTMVEMMSKLADSTESFDIYKLYGQFTMETIIATAFGRQVELLKGESDVIVDSVKNSLSSVNESAFLPLTILMPLFVMFPWLESPLRSLFYHTKMAKSARLLYSLSKQLVQERRKTSNPQKYKDLLQLMLDATVIRGGTSTQQKLSDDEIVAHGVTFMVAGHETTGSALSYITYHLAIYPTIQEKVQLEIDDYFENNPEAELYDAVQEMEYLDKVVHESLRLLPPVQSSVRRCLKTTMVNGVTIPKGVNVIVPTLCLHHDPKYWKDPETFDPERFSAEEKAKRSPLCWLPFSYGPRNCIGMRLAMLEIKLALILLLRKYTFVQAPETEVPLSVIFGLSTTPKHGVFLKVVKRN